MVSWEEEFAEVKSLKSDLVRLISEQQISAGFLQKLMLFQQVKNGQSDSGKKDKSYIWNATYYLARYGEKYKDKSEHPANKFLEDLKKKLFTGGGFPPHERYFDLAALAARWAEYEIKSNT